MTGVDGSEPKRYGRGLFLATVAGGITSLAWGRPVWSRVSSALAPVENLVPLTPKDGWRIYTVASTMPTFDPKTWSLHGGGLVENATSLDYAQLRALPRAYQVSDFHCVTGWSVHGVRWQGVRVADLLLRVKPLPSAGALQFVSAEEPYFDYLTMEQAL